MVQHLAGLASMPVQLRKSTTSACCLRIPSTVPLKILRSSAKAEAPGRSSVDSFTPVSWSCRSAWRSGLIAAVNRCGLSGQPWNTPTSWVTGSVCPSAALPTVKAASL
ncbi:hypothetical protein PC116_g34340 [Phytophthora cactorum]|uniref:Uncharacterized protein n=1 Tax=Phytophthora cactorum TaxID=29920 RepID=A0A8T1A1V4_9STRA|nr:hypothetical protein PC117_g28547 [Phytophthora cactorum]KAG4217179.1 hypothetical protein PC116_g34340 [Phytophthora cactorum]